MFVDRGEELLNSKNNMGKSMVAVDNNKLLVSARNNLCKIGIETYLKTYCRWLSRKRMYGN